MKRTLSFLLVICLLAMGVLPATAAETSSVFADEVQYSVTDSNQVGWGLAFCFTLNAKGVTQTSTNSVKLDKATLAYAGENCKVTRIGAVVTHLPGAGADDSLMTREVAAELGTQQKAMQDIKVAKVCRTADDSCTFAIRINRIPYEMENTPVYVRPYVEIERDGEKVTLYGDTDSATYGDKYLQCSLDLPYSGTDIDGKGRLTVGETAVLDGKLYLELLDERDDWMVLPNDDSSITFGFFDAEGQSLGSCQEWMPEMSSNKASTTFDIDLPEGTAKVTILEVKIRYWTEWE